MELVLKLPCLCRCVLLDKNSCASALLGYRWFRTGNRLGVECIGGTLAKYGNFWTFKKKKCNRSKLFTELPPLGIDSNITMANRVVHGQARTLLF